jgi:hypothetical protein
MLSNGAPARKLIPTNIRRCPTIERAAASHLTLLPKKSIFDVHSAAMRTARTNAQRMGDRHVEAEV